MALQSWGSGAAAIGRRDKDRGEPQRRGGMAQMSTLYVVLVELLLFRLEISTSGLRAYV